MKHSSIRILDLGGGVSSFSLLKISQCFRGMQIGEMLEIRGFDADVRADFEKILPPFSYRMVDENRAPDPFIRIIKIES